MTFDTSLGLRRRSGNDANAELRAHAAELRLGLDAFQCFPRRRLALVDVFPVAVQRLGNAVLTHPGCEQIGRGPGRFLVRETAQRHTGRVIDEVHQTGFRTAFFQPVVVRTVELNQLAEVRFALAPGAMRLALATAAPQTRGEHPAPQRFARHFQAVVGCQMFRRQRRPEALVPLARIVLAHQLENLLASLLIGSVRSAADVTVHQSLGPARTVTLLQTLRMAVADLQQLGGCGQLQFPSFHSTQHFAAPQLLGTHPCPSHSRLLLRSLRVGDISIGRSRGHYHWASTTAIGDRSTIVHSQTIVGALLGTRGASMRFIFFLFSLSLDIHLTQVTPTSSVVAWLTASYPRVPIGDDSSLALRASRLATDHGLLAQALARRACPDCRDLRRLKREHELGAQSSSPECSLRAANLRHRLHDLSRPTQAQRL